MMYSLKDDSTKQLVVDMHQQGISGRQIGLKLGISPRACQEFLSKDTWKEWWAVQGEGGEQKVQNFSDKGVTGTVGVFGKSRRLTIEAEKDNSCVLLISDMHIPYHHPDALEFLQHLKEKYSPTRIICLGDELDKHALSFHDSDPDLPSAGDELRASLPVIKQLREMFPVMDILESNHGSLLYRKANHHGIPRQYLKSYNDVLGVDDSWRWHYDMTIELPNGMLCYLHHGKNVNVVKTSQTMSMCGVQGHYHESFKIDYWANPVNLYWGMQCGCLIDDSRYAFNYNNVNLKRPIIGTGLIVDSLPVLEPMVLDSYGRWNGRKKV